MGVAVLGYILLVVWRGDDEQARENAHNYTPTGLRRVLVMLCASSVYAVIQSGLSARAQLTVILVVALVALLTFALVRRTDGFVKGSVVFFGAVLVTSGGCGLLFEGLREPRFNVAALVRQDNSALGGFLIARSDKSVLMVVPQLHNGQPVPHSPSPRTGRRDGTSSAASVPATTSLERCVNAAAAQRASSGGARGCYVNRLMIVASDEVDKLIVGPRGLRVGLASYAVARRLASGARARADEVGAANNRRSSSSAALRGR